MHIDSQAPYLVILLKYNASEDMRVAIELNVNMK